MKLLKNCYGNFSLQTGTITIGLVDLSALLFSFWLAITEDNNLYSESEIANNSISKNFKLLACFYFLLTITVVLLILGALKGNTWLMIPWMGTKTSIIISLPTFLIYFLVESNHYREICVGTAAVIVMVIPIAMALLIYSVLVVVSYFAELGREKTKIAIEDQMLKRRVKKRMAGALRHV